MFKKMRRFKQQISKEKCIEILTVEPYGVLSLISDTGYPYGFPITHWYDKKNWTYPLFMEQKKDIKWIV